MGDIRRLGADDAALVNEWVGRDFPGCDLTAAMNEPMTVCLASGNGGAIFAWRGPGVFEGHCFYEEKGREAVEVCKAMLRRLADEHGARTVWVAVPAGDEPAHRKVRLFVRWVGFKPLGVKAFSHGECEVYSWEPGLCLL